MSIYKYGVLKDLHGAKAIRARHDGNKITSDKQNQIIQLMRDNNATKLLTTGDTSSDLKNNSVTYGQINKDVDYYEVFKKAGFMLYTTVGNHDMMNGNEDWKGTAILDTLCSKYIEIVEDGVELDDGVFMHSIHYRTNLSDIIDRLTEVQRNIEMINEGDPDTVHLLNIHWNVFEKLADPEIFPESITYQEISNYVTGAEAILVGHIHTGHSEIKLNNGCIVVSPNPHVRKNVKGRNHTPQIAMLSIDTGQDFGNRCVSTIIDLEHKLVEDAFKADYIELGESSLEFEVEDFNLDVSKYVDDMGKIDTAGMVSSLPDDEYKERTIDKIRQFMTF